MKLDKNVFLASAGLLIVIMVLSVVYYLPKLKSENAFYYKEDPLKKNSNLGLKGGESLTYLYYYKDSPEERMNITYRVLKNFGCVSFEAVEFQTSSGCIDQQGNDRNGSNLSLSNQFIDFYKPWMLAVEDGWNWKVRRISSVGGETTLNTYFFSAKGIENLNGLDAYRVEVSLDGRDNVTLWVDAKRRISIRQEQKGFITELADLNNK
ncbi:hypothetical protein HZC08_00455 [Candidatus Micrarchaeota archaeon]|nr:hypothetical protein [Candidatus Micrarchaeota archaeon]